MLWALHIATPRKFALVGVFMAGYCVIILSVLRLKTILDLGDNLQKDFTCKKQIELIDKWYFLG